MCLKREINPTINKKVLSLPHDQLTSSTYFSRPFQAGVRNRSISESPPPLSPLPPCCFQNVVILSISVMVRKREFLAEGNEEKSFVIFRCLKSKSNYLKKNRKLNSIMQPNYHYQKSQNYKKIIFFAVLL